MLAHLLESKCLLNFVPKSIKSFVFKCRYMHNCAGSIINEWIVISAAHCFSPPNPTTVDEYLVFPGAHDSTVLEKTDIKDYDGPLHKIHSLYFPKKWNHTQLFQDIAILVMDKPFKFNNEIKPIKMMEYQDSASQMRVGKKCKVAGWGKVESTFNGSVVPTDYDDKYPVFLQEVEVPIIDLEKCIKNYEDSNEGVIPTNLNFCAGKQGIDSCAVIQRIQRSTK